MAEKTKTHCFYRLLKLHTKKNPHEYHQEFLEDCKAKDVIPHGLMHHKTAKPGYSFGRISKQLDEHSQSCLERVAGSGPSCSDDG